MTLPTSFTSQMTKARNALSRLRAQGMQEEAPPQGRPFAKIALSPWTIEKLEALKDIVLADIHRYEPLPPEADPAEEEATAPEASAAEMPPKAEVHASEQRGRMQAASRREELGNLFDTFTPTREIILETIDDDKVKSDLAKLSPEAQKLYYLLYTEVEEAALGKYGGVGPNIMSLQRIKKALSTFADGRVADALTLLRSSRNDDPKSRSLSFALSQMLFFRAATGSKNLLPEARDEAKRSCIFDENFSDEKLARYRYHLAACEAYFDSERALGQLRDFHLHMPEHFTGEGGLAARDYIHFKSLIILAQTSPDLWLKPEREAILGLAYNTAGGLVFYIHFFRPAILAFLEENHKDYEEFLALENHLHDIIFHHQRIVDNLSQNFQDNGLVKGIKRPWTVQSRYLSMFLKAASLPSLEDVMTNISLDGRRYYSYKGVNSALKSAGLHVEEFWALWALRLSVDEDNKREDIIPDEIIVRESALFEIYEDLLQELKKAENDMLDADRWEKAEKYVTPFTFEKIQEVGTGRTVSPTSRGPKDPTFKSYYQSWSRDYMSAKKPSGLIDPRAEVGGFSSLEEIQSTFDGIERIVDDPVVGLNARVRIGYRKYLQQENTNPQKTKEKRQEAYGSHFKEFWWLYFIMIPLSTLTFIVIVSAQTYQNALRTILVLLAVFAVGGFIIYSTLKNSNNDNTPPPKS